MIAPRPVILWRALKFISTVQKKNSDCVNQQNRSNCVIQSEPSHRGRHISLIGLREWELALFWAMIKARSRQTPYSITYNETVIRGLVRSTRAEMHSHYRCLHSRSHMACLPASETHPPSTLLTQNLPLLDTFGVQNNWNGARVILLGTNWICLVWHMQENISMRIWLIKVGPPVTIKGLSLIKLGRTSAFQKNYIQNYCCFFLIFGTPF